MATEKRMLQVAENFNADSPLDCVIKTKGGKTAYGFIPQAIAERFESPAAPVIITNELFDHLDIKGTRINAVAQRGFPDMRDAVEFALNTPTAVAPGNSDGSFNIFFERQNEDKKGLLYANLIYAGEPVPCFIVRSISPCGKIKDEIAFQDGKIPSMATPDEFNDQMFEEEIKKNYGNRVSGKTWNKGNVMKSLRMHAQEGIFPNEAEMAELKEWIAKGKLDNLSDSSVGMYIKQALEQPNCEIFFRAAKESGALAKTTPELDAVINEDFLKIMERANIASPEIKSALVLSLMASKSEDKTATINNISKKYNLTNADDAITFANYGNRFIKTGKGDIELLWGVLEEITNNFKKRETLDAMKRMCQIHSPELCLTQGFKDKMAICTTMIDKAADLKRMMGEKMKTMPKGAGKEERTQAQEEVKKAFMLSLTNELRAQNEQPGIILTSHLANQRD